ncbi:hypothetical protein ABQE57_04045 [Mycolicibacterium elephantis]|uniref:hypothetical protein n=1 Tax=Mycolicibacterium elephantis TaxID=81858 RepID=UPI0006291A4C|nr:hypothetical protein [Mycolicibacterium elephantis]KKW64153.1 membrane protein [Mycolicibacterium elephantis]MCV7223540.1 hypothetical protein [Mycolicibacterium elephantis]OBF00541.1 hypothetical protein A5776_09705 [Mycolicibacterium elephantis]
MGAGLDGVAAGQHSDLTASADTTSPLRVVVLTLLALDGVLCAIAAAFFLPLRIGTIPFPISAFIAGAVNAALVWAALHWTSSPRVAALPLWTWLGAMAVMFLGGPGEDVIFGAAGLTAYAVLLLLLVCGTLPPALVLRRHVNA